MKEKIPYKMPIRCVNTGEVFESACAAGRAYGLDNSSISKCVKGKKPFCGKDKNGEKLVWAKVN
jgi:hypothetical protein